jgi:hypothetical protein
MAFIKSAFRVSRARGGATHSAGPVDLTFFFLAPEMNTSFNPNVVHWRQAFICRLSSIIEVFIEKRQM